MESGELPGVVGAGTCSSGVDGGKARDEVNKIEGSVQFSITFSSPEVSVVLLLVSAMQTSRAVEVLNPEGKSMASTTRTLEPPTSRMRTKLELTSSLLATITRNADELKDVTSPETVRINFNTACMSAGVDGR